jgi:phytoene dehydrogenase-like protein
MYEGQTMHQYFKYFGIVDKLNTKPLDADAFDVICFSDGQQYAHAIGYERFYETLAERFPAERKGIEEYCNLIRKVGNLITPDVLRQGKISAGGIEYMGMSIYDEIEKMIGDRRLKNVLAGSISQYAGHPQKSSIYEHAMVNHSNIEGAHMFVGDTQHVADAFVDVINSNGGDVFTSSSVTKIHLDGDKVDYIEVNGEVRIEADYVISAVHPSQTMSLLENNTIIKKAYFTRVNSLENSYGIFTTYLLMKKGQYKRRDSNFYLYDTPSVWSTYDDCKTDSLKSMLLCMQDNGIDDTTDVVTLLTPMTWQQIAKWESTQIGHRGEDYNEFKQMYGERMLDFACRFFPDLKESVHAIHTASPLTYRDYTLTPCGTAYGIIKDYHNPVVNHLPSRTKISNLLITGQNLNVHGCIGVSVSAAVTCGEIIGHEHLALKIGNA